MKKLIMMASCVLVGAMANAAIKATPCSACDVCGDKETSCQVWFKGKASGTVSTMEKRLTCKSVTKLQIKDCEMVLDSTNAPVIVVSGKKGGVAFTKTLTCSEFTWNIFGKKIDEVGVKKNTKLDSEIVFTAEDDEGTMGLSGVMFGDVKATYSAKSVSPCSAVEETIKYTPGKFKGSFIGWSIGECGCGRVMTAVINDCDDDPACLTFEDADDPELEHFYGTITLKCDTKNTGCLSR